MIEKSAEEKRADFLHKSHGHIEVSSHLGSALPQRKIIPRTWRTQRKVYGVAWPALSFQCRVIVSTELRPKRI